MHYKIETWVSYMFFVFLKKWNSTQQSQNGTKFDIAQLYFLSNYTKFDLIIMVDEELPPTFLIPISTQ